MAEEKYDVSGLSGRERSKANLKKGEQYRFTSKKQPTPEEKKAGWDKKLKGNQLMKAIFSRDFKGAKASELKKMMAEYFGCEQEDITNEAMMMMRQIEKAIQKADTGAFGLLMSRIYGQPKQDMKVDGEVTTVARTIILPKKQIHPEEGS